MIARQSSADVNVISLVGERGRELSSFIENDLGPEGVKRSVIVISTSDNPPLIRMRAALAATAVAEYFRDQGLSVMLMMDSVTRFAIAKREVGLSAGEPPLFQGLHAFRFTRSFRNCLSVLDALKKALLPPFTPFWLKATT